MTSTPVRSAALTRLAYLQDTKTPSPTTSDASARQASQPTITTRKSNGPRCFPMCGPVYLELGILAPDQGFGNVARRPISDLGSPSHERPRGRPVSSGSRDREALWLRWCA